MRDLAKEDREDWNRLWAAYLEFYEAPLPGNVSDKTWQRLTDPGSPHAHGLVAVTTDGQIVGFAHYLVQISTWSIEPVIQLQDLYVDRSERGQGIGRTLLQAVFVEAKTAGGSQVQWLTRRDNERARALYDKLADETDFIQYHRNCS
ncbi:GNAT family N-acetyltransferase [uncultured Erythrobacter sp.]|uniref:GNAT family N-acetyltransferase n=1 Tax=uncultured Erythrobacter sp. TaxID=263913 RepID=UPI00260E020C|nr:GNAT family N-acetyltransferase [uncultured Erythrobacter sp.]